MAASSSESACSEPEFDPSLWRAGLAACGSCAPEDGGALRGDAISSENMRIMSLIAFTSTVAASSALSSAAFGDVRCAPDTGLRSFGCGAGSDDRLAAALAGCSDCEG